MSTKKRAKATVNGIFNINKPSGKTSQDIVAYIKRLSGERHVGHAGTLDPIATGVLPICLGQATRMSEFIMENRKTYVAEITLGIDTDTYDSEGKIVQKTDPSGVTLEQVQALLPSLTGTVQQKPPAYCALKCGGKRCYKLARAGVAVEPDEREVKIYRIEIIDWEPPRFVIAVECGKGTYIRSIAHDIGLALGCGAHVSALRRTKYGPFEIEDSISLPQLEDAFGNGYWPDLLYAMDFVLQNWPAMIVSAERERDIFNGRPIPSASRDMAERCRAYSADGRFIAILRLLANSGLLQPEKVFRSEENDSIRRSNT